MKTKIYTLFFIVAGLNLANATVPVVSGVSILGEALYYATPNPDHVTTLTGFYAFSDADHNADASTFKWYAGTLADGSNKVFITGATTDRFEITSTQYGKYLFFEVTAKDDNAETGNVLVSTGTLVTSTSYSNSNISDVTRSSGTTHYLNTLMDNNTNFTATGSGTVVYIHGDFDLDGKNSIVINVTSGAQLIVSGAFITKNTVTINVDATSTFTIESGLIAKNGSALTINGTMSVDGDVKVEDEAVFTIPDGGTLDIEGDLTLGDLGNITIDGDMTVNGNFDTGTGGTITVNESGTLDVGGDLIGDANIAGTGDVTVGGLVDPAIDDGDTDQINGTLPIELMDFNATNSNGTVYIKWSTASETNNAYFDVERSANGIDFLVVNTTQGKGNSTVSNYYEAIDFNPENGANYYRLKQTDYDGKFTYSKLVYVQNSSNFELLMPLVYPNPVNRSATSILVLHSYEYKSMKVNILDISGKSRFVNLQVDENGYIHFPSALPKGVFLVHLEADNFRKIQKLIVQ